MEACLFLLECRDLFQGSESARASSKRYTHTRIHSTRTLTRARDFISTRSIINTIHTGVYDILYTRVTCACACESLTLVCKLVAERHCSLLADKVTCLQVL